MKAIFYLLFINLIFPVFALDIVYLENGDKISGSIIEMSKDLLTIKTEYGTLNIDRAYINRAELTSNFDEKINLDKNLIFKFLFNNTLNNEANQETINSYSGKPDYVTSINSEFEQCLYSNGQGSYMQIENTEKSNSYDDFTISFWIYPEDNTRTQYIYSQWTSTKESKAIGKLAVSYGQDVLIIYLVDQDGYYHTFTVPNIIEYQKWQSISIQKESELLSIFKNNDIKKKITLPFKELYTSSSTIYLLTAKYTDNNFKKYNFKGKIDQFILFNKAIDKSELKINSLSADSLTL